MMARTARWTTLASAGAAALAWAGADVRLAIVDWSTVDGGTDAIWDGAFTQGVSAQFLLAARHFNERRTDLVPDLQRVIDSGCDKTLHVVQWCETAGNPRRAVDDVLYMLRSFDPHIVAGFGGVDDAMAAAPLLQAWNNIPVVCHWASANRLSDKAVYPLFARTIPADHDHADMLASLVKQLGFNEVSLLWLVDGKDMASQLVTRLQDQGQRGHHFEFLYGDTPETNTIDAAVRGLALLELNVVICATWALQLSQIADAAAKYGLLTDQHHWIFTYFDRNPTLQEFQANANLTRLMHGSFRVGIAQNSPIWANYLAKYPSFDSYRAGINALFPPHGLRNSLERCKDRKLDFSLPPGYFSRETSQLGNEVWGYAYDAVIALGMAVCHIAPRGTTVPAGRDIYEALVNAVSFHGLSGNRVAFVNTTGDRDPNTAGFKITNWVNTSETVVGAWNQDMTAFDLSQNVTWKSGKQGVENAPPYLTPPPETSDHLPTWARALGYAEMILVLLCAALAVAWLAVRRDSLVVKLSQPVFMYIMCFGAALLGFAILPLTFEYSDAACMAFPWLLVLGVELLISPILAKSIRVGVMWYHPGFRRRDHWHVSELKYLGGVALCTLVDVILLLAWTLSAPLVYQRFVTVRDQWGNPMQSYGACVAKDQAVAAGFMITLLVLNGALAMGTTVVALWLSAAPEKFHEARWTAFAAVALGQCYVFGIPLVFAVGSSPTATFLVLSSLCCVSSLAILGAMFLPKVMQHMACLGWPSSNRSMSGEEGENNSNDRARVSRTYSPAFTQGTGGGHAQQHHHHHHHHPRANNVGGGSPNATAPPIGHRKSSMASPGASRHKAILSSASQHTHDGGGSTPAPAPASAPVPAPAEVVPLSHHDDSGLSSSPPPAPAMAFRVTNVAETAPPSTPPRELPVPPEVGNDNDEGEGDPGAPGLPKTFSLVVV